MSYERTGVLSVKDIEMPTRARLKKGPVVIIECPQDIPCDPCVDACRLDAISMSDINASPRVDWDKCTGCCQCIAKCPGLAIFVIDCTYSERECLIKLPYEFLPLPEVGEMVDALDRAGNVVGQARVVKVNLKARTKVLTIAVEQELAMTVRNIRYKAKGKV